MFEQYKCFDEAKEYLLNSGIVTNGTFFRFIYYAYLTCSEKQANKQEKKCVLSC